MNRVTAMKAFVYTGYGPPDVLQLSETVEAIRYMQEGRVRGKAVIVVYQSSPTRQGQTNIRPERNL